ncbi:exodeoxyribonuclease V subunit alpha [Colwelliaceae bacterium MEBiC 14330]
MRSAEMVGLVKKQSLTMASRTFSAVYQNFNQAKEHIYGIEAIDYFFAKEMLNALVFNGEQGVSVANESVAEQTSILISNLNHTFLALSASLRAGHSCLALSEIAEQHWGKSYGRKPVDILASQGNEVAMAGEQALDLLHPGFVFTDLVALKKMLLSLKISENDQNLLVCKDNKLYLRRYFQFENELAKAINLRLAQQNKYDCHQIAQCIKQLFPQSDDKGVAADIIDWQKIAVANAINKGFSVIAGGPGTGKTYTVTKLLAALVMLEQLSSTMVTQKNQLSIALVAPTGKAAQRLSESIVNAVTGFKGLISDDVLEKIPSQAQTVHRLLGVLPNSPNFKHHQDNQLTCDIVLIDEVSMVDLPLMTRIFRALKPSAKVILLGDADQLPSVAAGSVLADIAPRPHGGFSDSNTRYLSEVCQLTIAQIQQAFYQQQPGDGCTIDYLTFLVKSRRFDGKGGIGLLAKSVISGDVQSSWQLLANKENNPNKAQTELIIAQGDMQNWLAPLVQEYYQPLESCVNVKEAFSFLSKFRVLCATRQGEYGVEQVNELIKTLLGKNNSPYQQKQHALYHGQPIMINENDYRLNLYNGDIGIIWRFADKTGQSHLIACFESPDEADNDEEGVRYILPSRLPKFESVYAMTIHKTQGSEFAHVAMIISANQNELADNQAKASKLLSRELLYTGITRAKQKLTVSANQVVWRQAVSAQVQRHSGLSIKPRD